MRRFLSSLYRSMKFQTKILCIVGFVALIPSVMVFFLFFRQLSSLYVQELDTIERSFNQQADSVSRRMESAISSAIRISSISEFSQFFSLQGNRSTYVIEYNTAIRPLLSYIQSTKSADIGAIRFYTRNHNLFSTLSIQNFYFSQESDFFDEISARLEENRTVVYFTEQERNYISTPYSAPETLSVFAPILTPSFAKTFIECELSFDDIFQTLETATNGFETTGYTLLHSSGSALFTSDQDLLEAVRASLPELSGDDDQWSGKADYGKKTYLLHARYIPSIGCILISYSDLSLLTNTMIQTIAISAIVTLLCGFASWFLALTLVNGLLRRTETINSAIRQIQGGDFAISLPVYGADFIDQIAMNLNSMASQIENLIQNNYEKQLQIKNLHIRMISQQISPHFLYNTLECLKMNAVLEGQEKNARALTSLGRLLRYYANDSSDFATMGEELKEVQDYVDIMNLIEERKCIYEKTVPEECLTCRLPRFLIQPLVENAIKHGSRSYSSEIRIHLTITLEEDLLHLTIADDGVGIPPETIREIRQKLESGQSSYEYGSKPASIGLYNTNARIKLIYGDAYGITLDSIPGEGCTVQFTIPFSPLQGKSEQQDRKELS